MTRTRKCWILILTIQNHAGVRKCFADWWINLKTGSLQVRVRRRYPEADRFIRQAPLITCFNSGIHMIKSFLRIRESYTPWAGRIFPPCRPGRGGKIMIKIAGRNCHESAVPEICGSYYRR